MARKKHAKHSRRRHRRISGIGAAGTGILVKVGGAVLGKVLSNQVGKMYSGPGSDYVAAAAPIAGGILTGMLVKGSTGKALAEGMYIAGGLQLGAKLVPGVLGAMRSDYNMNYDRNFVALGPSLQNPRGVVAGIVPPDGKLTTKRAAVLAA